MPSIPKASNGATNNDRPFCINALPGDPGSAWLSSGSSPKQLFKPPYAAPRIGFFPVSQPSNPQSSKPNLPGSCQVMPPLPSMPSLQLPTTSSSLLPGVPSQSNYESLSSNSQHHPSTSPR
ncbi:unnamed protein product [Protopolystoma xenopodis]|uniref:Uncharacterized protein n=1 Tax=Protopolystoma xenopodis TaxID=117903 RepID=A0A448XL54_9PLAT|nr:unnamed protein product [Protopolystoma xenopodis]